MIKPDDIKRLIEANASIRDELSRNDPRAAARIVCDQLNWLAGQESFWKGLRDLSGTITDNFETASGVLTNLTDFIDAESVILNSLGFNEAKTEAVVGSVYADIGIIHRIDPEDITSVGFTNLQKHVKDAAKVVCRQRQNAFMRGVDWVVSWKGARIMAGAAIAGANGLAFTATVLTGHPLLPLAAAVSTASITIGSTLIKGDALGLLELLKPRG